MNTCCQIAASLKNFFSIRVSYIQSAVGTFHFLANQLASSSPYSASVALMLAGICWSRRPGYPLSPVWVPRQTQLTEPTVTQPERAHLAQESHPQLFLPAGVALIIFGHQWCAIRRENMSVGQILAEKMSGKERGQRSKNESSLFGNTEVLIVPGLTGYWGHCITVFILIYWSEARVSVLTFHLKPIKKNIQVHYF